ALDQLAGDRVAREVTRVCVDRLEQLATVPLLRHWWRRGPGAGPAAVPSARRGPEEAEGPGHRCRRRRWAGRRLCRRGPRHGALPRFRRQEARREGRRQERRQRSARPSPRGAATGRPATGRAGWRFSRRRFSGRRFSGGRLSRWRRGRPGPAAATGHPCSTAGPVDRQTAHEQTDGGAEEETARTTEGPGPGQETRSRRRGQAAQGIAQIARGGPDQGHPGGNRLPVAAQWRAGRWRARGRLQSSWWWRAGSGAGEAPRGEKESRKPQRT